VGSVLEFFWAEHSGLVLGDIFRWVGGSYYLLCKSIFYLGIKFGEFG
jgi:hypothetical protein